MPEKWTGYLIYHSEEAKKNKAFIHFFQEEGEKNGISFTYVSKNQFRQMPLPELVLNRTRDAAVSKWYEEQKIPVFHGSFLTEIGNHKQKTLQYLKEHLPESVLQSKWAPATFFLSKAEIQMWISLLREPQKDIREMMLQQLLRQQKGEKGLRLSENSPLVIKSADGHGGTEVAEIPESFAMMKEKIISGQGKEREKLLALFRRFAGKECLIQEKILSDSMDIRVYILGNQIYQAVRRKGTKDFRSNYSLGGDAEAYILSAGEKEWITYFLHAFATETIGLAGLDFILDRQGHLIFNELEEMVGCRMLYYCTESNVVKDYVLWIKKFVENNGCHHVKI